MFQYQIKSNISCNLTALRPSQGTTRPWSSTIPLCRHFRGLHADQLGHFARESKTHYRPSIDHLPLCGHHSIRRSIENRRIAEHKRHEVHVGFGWGMQTSRGKIFRNIWALFKIIIVITKFRLAFQSCFHIVLSFEWENAARNSVPSANRSAQNNQGYRMDGRRDCGVHDIQVNGFLKYLFTLQVTTIFFQSSRKYAKHLCVHKVPFRSAGCGANRAWIASDYLSAIDRGSHSLWSDSRMDGQHERTNWSVDWCRQRRYPNHVLQFVGLWWLPTGRLCCERSSYWKLELYYKQVKCILHFSMQSISKNHVIVIFLKEIRNGLSTIWRAQPKSKYPGSKSSISAAGLCAISCH